MFNISDIKRWLTCMGYEVSFVNKPKHILMKYVNIKNMTKGHYFFDIKNIETIDEDFLYFEFFIKLMGNTSGWGYETKCTDIYKVFPSLKVQYNKKILTFMWEKRKYHLHQWMILCFNIDVYSKINSTYVHTEFLDWFQKLTGLSFYKYSIIDKPTQLYSFSASGIVKL